MNWLEIAAAICHGPYQLDIPDRMTPPDHLSDDNYDDDAARFVEDRDDVNDELWLLERALEEINHVHR